jgi:steroid 5-alpha reductase family enzyme
MEFLELYGWALVVVLGLVTLLWAVSVPLQDASIIDMFWGILFVAVAWVLLAVLGELATRPYLMTLLVTVWGLRLAFHLMSRNLGQGEDKRYRRWRERGGANWWLKSYYRVYLLQGAIALVVATPLIAAFYRPYGFNLLNVLGVLVWATGFLYELMADVQLSQFKADPDNRGRILDRGLWGLSRHPNYFGDALQWWGLGLVALSWDTWWALIGPAVMTAVFLGISNDVLERDLRRRRPEYADYVTKTPKFFPRLPHSAAPRA